MPGVVALARAAPARVRRATVPALVALFGSACLGAPPAVGPPAGPLRPVTRRFGDLTLHVINTGWVRVKEAHRTLVGPEALRLLTIAFDRRWTPFMPALVGVIDHPEGVFLVDAGMSEATLEPEHYAGDPANAFVYRNLLDFRFEATQRVDRQLSALGIDPGRVRGIVLTHLHADHADALSRLPANAEVFVGAGDWPGHNGALRHRWPRGAPTLVADAGPPAGAFPHARPLTDDGRVLVVPLRGHSPGHLGVLVRTPPGDVLFGGDAAFDAQQVARRRLAGIVEVPSDARQSLDVLARQVTSHRTFLLFSHDPASLVRFEHDEPTTLPPPPRPAT
jgi:glyoxylase-like metal-dependent hydrolase (beta-lactamase superfamily II)